MQYSKQRVHIQLSPTVAMHVCVLKSPQSCSTLCNPMDCSPPESSVHGILQARILEYPCPPPGDLPDPGTEPTSLTSPLLAGGFFTTSTTWEVHLGIMDSYCLLSLESNYVCQKFQSTSRMPLDISIIFDITS